jgi:N-acetylglutamate synthase/N-acetylornithine aminotransferase
MWLGVVTCDADVEPEVWLGMLRRACDVSFNAVSGTVTREVAVTVDCA